MTEETIIRKAEIIDAEELYCLIEKVNENMQKHGMDHWIGFYSLERVQKRIQEEDVYLLFLDGEMIGSITLSENGQYYYDKTIEDIWESKPEDSINVCGLVVHPEHQQKGYGKELMYFAEDEVKKRKKHYIRCDAVTYYEKLVDFYLSLGYEVKDNRTIEKWNLNFYEKKIE